MSPLLAALICIAAYVVAYRVYARFLAERVFVIDPARPTPAVRFRDEIDYVPANRYVLFGHQYASITGLSPMLGPAIAVIWGWLPAMVWVVLGAIFVGAVHDFGALVVSIRARGMSLGKVTENLVGPRGKTLFHLVIFFLIALAMGVFVHVIAVLFSPDFYPQAVLPSGALVFVAAAMGVAVHRGGWSIRSLTVAGLAVALGLAFLGIRQPVVGPSLAQWKWLLLAYAFGASVAAGMAAAAAARLHQQFAAVCRRGRDVHRFRRHQPVVRRPGGGPGAGGELHRSSHSSSWSSRAARRAGSTR